MLSEIKVALRGLLKSPGFTVIAIATLALAIGATTSVVSLINALLVRPLPYQQPSKLVLIWERFAAQGLDRIPVSSPEYLDLENQFHGCTKIAAFTYETFNLGGGDLPERISGAVVSPALFPLLGVEPIKGRTFAREEQGQGHDDVIVISERLWKRRFNTDPFLVGKSLLLNGRSYTVIGVMPAKFEFPIPLFGVQGNQFAERVDIWKPIAFTPLELKERGSRSYGLIARLRSAVSEGKAQAELDTIISNWIREYPDNYRGSGFGAKIYSLHDQVVGGLRIGLAILLGAVVLVLLIACANLATMLLARASARERELAIRVALGAGPWRLLRQMLTESVLLALAGAAGGVVLSIWGLDLLKHIGARTVPRLAEVNVDLVVLVITAVVAVGTGILFGLIPALASAKPELTEALKEGGRGSTTGARRNRLRNSLVVAEIALALVLLVGAGLLMKSYMRLQNIDPGFDRRNVLTAEIDLSDTKYPRRASADYRRGEAMINFWNEALRRVRQLPGVEGVGCTIVLPMSGSNTDSSFAIEGRSAGGKEPTPDEEIRIITPDYFRVLKTLLVRGRFFADSDNADAPPVTIINDALARKYWPNQDALGKRITLDDPRKDPKWLTIVGIVRGIRHRGLDTDPEPEYYIPVAQRAERSMILAVRSAQDPRNLMSALRREIQSIDPDQPIANVRTLDAVTADSIAPRRMSVVLLGVFAVIALVLAAVGIFGVISCLVLQRTHEIGVRMALGAQRCDVLRLVVGHALKLVGIGTAIGLVLAFLSTRALAALLYNVGAFDPATFAIVTVVLTTIAFLASYIPALRATRADPMIALSHNA
ncbi:MAG TPA: ABC transporter permease [Chthoniobacterales bacterium]|jgi:putative ABC transport system permease protein|nr:ABC transporter permease [Chthoniobacterales bacterium]